MKNQSTQLVQKGWIGLMFLTNLFMLMYVSSPKGLFHDIVFYTVLVTFVSASTIMLIDYYWTYEDIYRVK